jgi:hypothetical protein
MSYLSYDVRGIQSFIFAVPRLRYIVGGSAIVDRFDTETARAVARELAGVERIQSGGGKGVFRLARADQAKELTERLVGEGRSVGLDLRIRESKTFAGLWSAADRLHPYLPAGSELEGHPCPESGLYPVRDGSAAHPMMRRRIFSDGDRLGKWFEDRLRPESDWHPEIRSDVEFLRDVEDGSKGHIALGRSNRWAVVCMDGNEIGKQFAAIERGNLSPEAREAWVRSASEALAQATFEACRRGIVAVLRDWFAGLEESERRELTQGGAWTLPVRPLILGGDDISILCDARHAATFVQTAIRAFEDTSRRLATDHGGGLWPASGDSLSMSAGVLYAPIGLPLASAIPYAETLLENAKRRGKSGARRADQPPLACIDWENVTEGVLDSPDVRRLRRLCFIDGDEETTATEIRLTERPYTLGDFEALTDLSRELFSEGRHALPRSLAHKLVTGLRAGRHEREMLYARLGKRWSHWTQRLDEESSQPDSLWRKNRDGQVVLKSTRLVDAFLLAEEGRRTSKETER